MENVSHNTSFDSNEDGGEDLSRAQSQTKLEHDWSAVKHETHYQDRSGLLNRQTSEADTVQNPYGFGDEYDNYPHQVQQAIWQDFQRTQQQIFDAEEAKNNRPFTRSDVFSPEELASDQVSRPTAGFGNQFGESATIYYPDEVVMEDGESDFKPKDQNLPIGIRDTPQQFYDNGRNYDTGGNDRFLNTEEAKQKFYAPNFIPEEVQNLESQSLLRSHEPHLRNASAGSKPVLTQTESNRQKKRSRADFLNNQPSNTADKLHNSTHHSNQSSILSKESIIQSVRNQQQAAAAAQSTKQKPERDLEEKKNKKHLKDVQRNLMDSGQISPTQMQEHVRKHQVSDQSHRMISHHNPIFEEYIRDQEEQAQAQQYRNSETGDFDGLQVPSHARRYSFPRTDDGALEPIPLDQRAKTLALLRQRISAKQQLERIQKRLAFD